VIVPVSADGKIELYEGGATVGSTQLIVDLFGYYSTS